MIVFIPRSSAECNHGDGDPEWLPRQCPACHHSAIVGHGRRQRQAHDPQHDWICVRRGWCKFCHRTVTVLPAWCVPHAPYTLLARQAACARLAQGASAAQAAPYCRSPDHLPDGSTVRRWAGLRFHSLRLWWSAAAAPTVLVWGRAAAAPTLLAWDFVACARMLTMETHSP